VSELLLSVEVLDAGFSFVFVRVGKDFVGLSLPSVVRSEVFTDRHAILAAINHKLGSQRIFELR
jgi:hypothetical protein